LKARHTTETGTSKGEVGGPIGRRLRVKGGRRLEKKQGGRGDRTEGREWSELKGPIEPQTIVAKMNSDGGKGKRRGEKRGKPVGAPDRGNWQRTIEKYAIRVSLAKEYGVRGKAKTRN